MKLNEKALANTSALLVGIVYIVCAFLVAVFPDLFRVIAESWFHGIDLGEIWTGAPRGNFIVGLITAASGSWLTGWAFAWIYNKLVK